MLDSDKTVKDEAKEDETVEPTQDEQAETKDEADEKGTEEATSEEPKTEEPAEDAATPAENAVESAGTDQQGRQLYNVKCSDCGKETQVTFKPSGDRPVYCRDCYMQKRNARG